MSVDFGLLCLFVLQLAMVLAVYHAWRGIKAEIAALEALRRGNAEVTARVDTFTAKMDAQADRIQALEGAPKAVRNRLDELHEDIKAVSRKVEAGKPRLFPLLPACPRLGARGKR